MSIDVIDTKLSYLHDISLTKPIICPNCGSTGHLWDEKPLMSDNRHYWFCQKHCKQSMIAIPKIRGSSVVFQNIKDYAVFCPKCDKQASRIPLKHNALNAIGRRGSKKPFNEWVFLHKCDKCNLVLETVGSKIILLQRAYALRRNIPISIGTNTPANTLAAKKQKYTIYFVRLKGTPYIKIGISKELHNRMKSFVTNNPFDCELVYSIEVESRKKALEIESFLHDYYKTNRVRPNNEWFILTNEEIDKAKGISLVS